MSDSYGKNSGDSNKPMIIGWREPVALPDWGIKTIKTKIDTGARTSAIHVDHVEERPNGRVRFDVIVKAGDDPDSPHESVPVETAVVRTSCVRSSDGFLGHRLVVRTRVRLGDWEREIELSLVSRHGMLCRLLLGRLALKDAFLIDPGTTRRLPRTRRPAGTPTTTKQSQERSP